MGIQLDILFRVESTGPVEGSLRWRNSANR